MGAINNLSQPNFSDINRRLKALENAAPMNNGAVGRSGFEVYDGGNINISNGSITINGALTGGGTFGWTGAFSQSGTSTFTGTTNLNGPTNVAGAFTVTGVTKLNGATDIGGNTNVTGTLNVTNTTTLGGNTTVSGTLTTTGAMSTKGTLSVEGVTTLKNNLNVASGSQVVLGNITLKSGGATGDKISVGSGSIASDPGLGTLILDDILSLGGTSKLQLLGSNIQMPNLPSTASTTAKAVVYDTSTKQLYYKA